MLTRAFLLDALERALSTFAQAFLAAYTVDGWESGLKVAGIAAGLAVLKALAATRVGAPDSGSLLPADVDPPVDDAGAGEVRTILLFAAGTLLALVLYYFAVAPLFQRC